MTLTEAICAVISVYGMALLGYIAGWADNERKHREESHE